MAKLYFRYGAMGSSKTANAIMVQLQLSASGARTRSMLKPALDSRDGETSGRLAAAALSAPATSWRTSTDTTVQHYDCVIVDEAQFLTKAQVEQLVDVVDERGIPVICLRPARGLSGQSLRGQPVAAGLGGHHRGGQDHLLVRQEGHLQRPRRGRQGGQGRASRSCWAATSSYVGLCRKHWIEGKLKP